MTSPHYHYAPCLCLVRHWAKALVLGQLESSVQSGFGLEKLALSGLALTKLALTNLALKGLSCTKGLLVS